MSFGDRSGSESERSFAKERQLSVALLLPELGTLLDPFFSEERKAAFRTSICGYNSDPARRELHKCLILIAVQYLLARLDSLSPLLGK